MRRAKKVIPRGVSFIIGHNESPSSPSSRNPSGPISTPPRHNNRHVLLPFPADPAADTAVVFDPGVASPAALAGLGRVGKRHVREKDTAALGRAGLAKGFARLGEGATSGAVIGRIAVVDMLAPAPGPTMGRGRGRRASRVTPTCRSSIVGVRDLKLARIRQTACVFLPPSRLIRPRLLV